MFKKFEKFLKESNIVYKKNENIKSHTSIRIGGRVKFFIEVKDINTLKGIIQKCKQLKIKTFVIGNGTNLVFSDKTLKIVVLKLCFKNIRKSGNNLIAGCGVNLFSLNLYAAKHSLSGLEWSYGIPGTIGGAVFMNAGSFGGEIKDVIVSAKVLDENNEIKTLLKEDMSFDYRKSVFQKTNYIILEAKFKLSLGEEEAIFKKCLLNLNTRKQNQPYDMFSAGSVFKKVEDISSWRFIEDVGFRGYRIGGAMVSRKHCGFIVNVQNAKFYDVLKIIYEIKKTVYKKFAIILEEEIQFIGDNNEHLGRLSHTFNLQQKKLVSKKTRKRDT